MISTFKVIRTLLFFFHKEAHWLYAVVARHWRNPSIPAAAVYVYFHVLLLILAIIRCIKLSTFDLYVIMSSE